MTDSDSQAHAPEPPRIRALRRLVTVLTVVMILGMVTVVGLLAWRLTAPAPSAALPEDIALPEGERLTGYAQNPDWTVLITEDAAGTQRLHLIRPGSETIHQTTEIRSGD